MSLNEWKKQVNKNPNIPTLTGFPKDNKTIYVWCPYCHNWHIHSYKPDAFYQGHRTPHCGTPMNKPTQTTGYHIINTQHPTYKKLNRETIDTLT